MNYALDGFLGENRQAIATAMLQSSPKAAERINKLLQEQGIERHKLSIRLEKVGCGRKCKGCPHGPYLYAYWKQDGKVRSKYIGKPGK